MSDVKEISIFSPFIFPNSHVIGWIFAISGIILVCIAGYLYWRELSEEIDRLQAENERLDFELTQALNAIHILRGKQ